MRNDEVLTALSSRPLCLSCLASITAPLDRNALLALLGCEVTSTVDRCVVCKSDTKMTYRFDRPRRVAA